MCRGKYQDENNNAWDVECKNCGKCDTGKYWTICELSSGSKCETCVVGKYQDNDHNDWEDGCKVCNDCEAGKYKIGCGGSIAGTCSACATGDFACIITDNIVIIIAGVCVSLIFVFVIYCLCCCGKHGVFFLDQIDHLNNKIDELNH